MTISITIPHDILRQSEQEAAAKLYDQISTHRPAHPSDLSPYFIDIFKRGDFLVELYAPQGKDHQIPHKQDEIYIISSGSGTFRRAAEYVDFSTGDLIFVPAGVDHRFEEFSDDFRAWVVLFGPDGGCSQLDE